mmetsp:Transcript_12569/g.13781  ORF Transcript_12569/g.13781 Transcript_12569/m.13781 type:complete len:421 (-) Transcript_12569:209-1471(-)
MSFLSGNKMDSGINNSTAEESTRLVLSSPTSGEPLSSPTSLSSSSLRSRIYHYSAISVVTIALLALAGSSLLTSPTTSSLDSSLLLSTSKDASQWPTELYTALFSSSNAYKGNGDLGSGTLGTTGRPTTTTEATANGWASIQKECVPNLGYPWAFNGKITSDAPVTLYYSKETKQDGGVLTGFAVHYYDNIAPEKMVGSVFSKGEEYDTLPISLRDENTDVCGEASLPSNTPYYALLLANGKGRKVLPLTVDIAKASGEWAKGGCIPGMGVHWWHDFETGSDLSYEANNLFPIGIMYDQKTGSLNGFLIIAKKDMQTGKLPKTNMWDGASGEQLPKFPKPPELGMCVNFCVGNGKNNTCPLTGALGNPPSYGQMHWFFVKKEEISACTSYSGPSCKEFNSVEQASANAFPGKTNFDSCEN